jgi:MarR family transcriptional regulator, transcriptional regulator for hemolysin
MSGRPATEPIGLHVQRTAKTLNRAFEAALAEEGGSLPTWLVLLSLKSGRGRNQRELAEAVGIRGATMTHHLDALEKNGLVTRRRDPGNRRVQIVELTAEGDALFDRLRGAAMAFDRKLRTGMSAEEVTTLGELLTKLAGNVTD